MVSGKKPPRLRIAPPIEAPLEYLSDAAPVDLDRILATLQGASPTLEPEEVVEELIHQVPVEFETAYDVLAMALSLRSLVREYDADAVATGVASAYAESRKFPNEKREQLRSSIRRLLVTEYVTYEEKVNRLSFAAGLTIAQSRCVVDLRPVFEEAADDDDTDDEHVRGFITLHTIELRVTGTDDKTLYLNVDEEGLRDLRSVIDRSLKKSAALRELVDATGHVDYTAKADDD